MSNRLTMKTMILVLLVGLLSLALLSCGPASVRQSDQQVAPQMDPTPDADYHGVMFPGLEGIPPDQLFDHFLGGQFTMTDKEGTAFTINMIPGTVESVSNTSIVITPNGQTITQTFNITPSTIVNAAPERGSIQSIVRVTR